MPDFERASVMLDSESRTVAVRRRFPDLRKFRRVCASMPTIIVETLDAIARDTGRSRSAVISDALLAHPDIAAALTARGHR